MCSRELEPGTILLLDCCHDKTVVKLAKARIANDKGEFDIFFRRDFHARLFNLGDVITGHR